MEYRELGRSGLKVSTLSIGCWPIVGDAIWGPQDEAEGIAALRTALDNGINFFDSAEAYGDGYSEELLGRALAGVRDKAIIASKVATAHLSADRVQAACEASLKRLGTDYIDVYYIHWPSRTVPLSETVEALQKLKQAGKIRFIGASNFGVQDLPDLLKLEHVHVNQLPYNLLWRAIEFEILPICLKENVSVTCYMPLMQGLLTGKFRSPADVPDMRARTRHFSAQRPHTRHGEPGAEEETFATLDRIRQICQDAGLPMAHVALAWLMRRPGVASVIVGVRNPQQVMDNLAAASLHLSDSMMRALDEATEPLKQKMGTNPDMWMSAANSRYR